jgi:hypothetical protein
MAVLVGLIALWYYTLTQARMQSGEIEDEQSFQVMSASLTGELQRDIRSSLAITAVNSRTWEIETVTIEGDSLPVSEKVVYELSSDQLKVFVRRNGREKVYDFTHASGGKKITFNIVR